MAKAHWFKDDAAFHEAMQIYDETGDRAPVLHQNKMVDKFYGRTHFLMAGEESALRFSFFMAGICHISRLRLQLTGLL